MSALGSKEDIARKTGRVRVPKATLKRRMNIDLVSVARLSVSHGGEYIQEGLAGLLSLVGYQPYRTTTNMLQRQYGYWAKTVTRRMVAVQPPGSGEVTVGRISGGLQRASTDEIAFGISYDVHCDLSAVVPTKRQYTT